MVSYSLFLWNSEHLPFFRHIVFKLVEFFQLCHGGRKIGGDLCEFITFLSTIVAQTKFGIGTAFDGNFLLFFGCCRFFRLFISPCGFIQFFQRFPPGFVDAVEIFYFSSFRFTCLLRFSSIASSFLVSPSFSLSMAQSDSLSGT